MILYWRVPYLLTFIGTVIIACVVLPRGVLADDAKILAKNIVAQVPLTKSTGLVVVDVETGKEVFSRNAGLPLKPASVLKILITDVAFAKLGTEHSFRTEFYGVGFKGAQVESLYMKGYGDPSFVQEQLWLSARNIYKRGVRQVKNIFVDDSAFVDPSKRQGQRAYQAGASALAFNHNALVFEICPGRSGSPASVTPDLFEYPVRIKGRITTTSKGSSTYQIDETAPPSHAPKLMSYLVQGRIRGGLACTNVLRSVEHPDIYAGYGLKGFLEELGVKVLTEPKNSKVPPRAARIYTHYSKQLALIVRDLNHYSTNFIAEQLLMAVGATGKGRYERKAGLRAMEQRLLEVGEAPGDFSLHDASGLSHSNRITARGLSKVLMSLRANTRYGAEFVNSLAVDGRRGTLRKRNLNGTVRAKTGTINGVGSLAGFITSAKGREFGFVFLQNKVSSRAKASTIENKLMRVLYKS